MTYSDQVKCCTCDTVFEDEKSHNSHHKAEHPNEPYICQLCDLELNNRASYYKHKHNNHYKPFGCNSCDFKAAKVNLIIAHIKRSHNASSKRTKRSSNEEKKYSTRKAQENSVNSHTGENNTHEKNIAPKDLIKESAIKNERNEEKSIINSDVSISTEIQNDDPFDDNNQQDTVGFSDDDVQTENQGIFTILYLLALPLSNISQLNFFLFIYFSKLYYP